MPSNGTRRIERDPRDYVKGATSQVPYVVRNPSGDWEGFFRPDSWVEQRYEGLYDTDCCWLFHAVDKWEIELEWLRNNGQFGDDALKFFGDNGYLDQQGNFKLSRDYLAILSGVTNQGNTQIASPKLLASWGIVGASSLSYTGNDQTYQSFISNFFNPNRITQQMEALAKRFLDYVDVAYEWIGDGDRTPPIEDMRANLLQSPLGIGIPIPRDVSSWNSTYVKWDGSTDVAHAVTLLAVNPDGSYRILDQYNPPIKTLSSDYFIPLIDNNYLSAAAPAIPQPIDQSAPVPSLWASIAAFWRGIFGS